MLYTVGSFAISLLAIADVLPELIPGPNVPMPIHKAADSTRILSRILFGLTLSASNTRAMTSERTIGVSIIALLIKVRVSYDEYAWRLIPRPCQADLANAPMPMIGPKQLKPTAAPVATKRKLSVMFVHEPELAFMSNAMMNPKMIGV